MYKRRQELDEVAWDKNDADEQESLMHMGKGSLCRRVVALGTQKCQRRAKLIRVIPGGLNIHYRLRLAPEAEQSLGNSDDSNSSDEDGNEDASSDVMVRVPWPDASQFPDEKIFYEAATSEFIRLNTPIPVPQVLHSGRATDIGAFLIQHRVENNGDMKDPLARKDRIPGDPFQLNTDLAEQTRRTLWAKLAFCVLEVAKPRFGSIGSLLEVDGLIQVARRPLTQNMSTMTGLANIPRAIFPAENKTFATADEWYLELSKMHLAQLVFQHNDLVASENDCRNKYVARQIWRNLAKQGRLSTFGFAEDSWSADAMKTNRPRLAAPSGSDDFRIWCDDFRPANALISGEGDNIEVVAVIDWEFAYVAPTQFVLDPPWWLLFDVPELWLPSGVDEWSKAYEPQLEIWLKAMEDQEAGAPFLDGVPLSKHMRESWDTGRFWLNYAARKSWAFDAVYWTFLDERFFGPRDAGVADEDLWKTRIHMLGQAEILAMESFVAQKMKESETRVLVDWEAEEAKKRLSDLLFD